MLKDVEDAMGYFTAKRHGRHPQQIPSFPDARFLGAWILISSRNSTCAKVNTK
jgi:hypothetical protein